MIHNAINGVSSMLLIIILGYFIAGSRLFQQNNGAALISKYLTRIALPVYMVYNTTSLFDSREDLLAIVSVLIVPFCLIVVGMAAGFLAAAGLRIEEHRRGIFVNACGLGNTVFLGIPIAQVILGDAAVPMAMTFYMVNTFLFWTLGTFFLSKDNNRESRLFTKEGLKRIFSLPLIGFLLGIALVLIEVPIPQFLNSAMETVSRTSPGLGMIFIGSIIRETKLSEGGYLKDCSILLLLKLVLLPLLVLVLLSLMPIPLQAKQTFFIMMLMPGMTQLGLMSKELGSDYKFASTWVAVSTLVCVITVPLQVWLMTAFLK